VGLANVDVVVIGGGIVGLATALAVVRLRQELSVVVLEKERAVASHQTGHNSGVIHTGLYYKPGSLKARTCARGRGLLERFCHEHDVRVDRCGKVVVATHANQVPRLEELERRGQANGVSGLRRLAMGELREREPHAAGVQALLVPETAIVDYREVAAAYTRELVRRGCSVRMEAAASTIRRRGSAILVASTAGDVQARVLVACAGLASDRVARMAGLPLDVAIVPFRGEYWMLAPHSAHLVKHLIYPVPDPAFPFLGVHFTRRIGGGIEAGPNAVLAWKREGYERTSFEITDAWEIARWRAALQEQTRSWSAAAFARTCAALVPELTERDLIPGGAGVRAQAVARDGTLLDDFAIVQAERMVHVVNAPSPAATASLAIGEHVAELALRWV
jgi:L-2-hydroxyglutarate oxidase LhgO